MKDYKLYTSEDFSNDLSFRNYVLQLDEQDIIFWKNWIEMNPEKENEILKGREILLSIIEGFENISDEDMDFELAQLNDKIDLQEHENTSYKKILFNNIWYKVAAIFLLVTGIWVYRLNFYPEKTNSYEALMSQVGEKDWVEKINSNEKLMVVTLSDGSSIVLEKGSKISYPKQFKDGKREVIFSGAAFFEIAKDPTMPFYVYTNNLVTKVLGTSFTIHQDAKTNEVKVIVKTGRVSVFARNEANLTVQQANSMLGGLILTPNQQVVFNGENLNLVRTLVETPEVVTLPILQQQFDFERTPISEVFQSLEKFYGLKIIYDGEVMKNCFLTASLSDEPLFDKLDLICKTINAHYEQIDAQIIIYSKGCY